MDSKLKQFDSKNEESLKDEQPLLKSESTTPISSDNLEELEKKVAAYVRNDVYGTMGRGELPLTEKFLLGFALLTLVPIRLLLGFIILVCYYLICRFCTLFSVANSDDGQDDYAHLVGWRRTVIVGCGKCLSRAMLFVLGFYWIDEYYRNLLSQAELESKGAPVKLRRPSDYNSSLTAALGPNQPNPNLNLVPAELTPGADTGLKDPDRVFVGEETPTFVNLDAPPVFDVYLNEEDDWEAPVARLQEEVTNVHAKVATFIASQDQQSVRIEDLLAAIGASAPPTTTQTTLDGIDENHCQMLSDELETRPGAIVSNHISYLDILYHMSSSFPSFVAKRSVAKLPLVGLISKCLGCVYVQRESKSSNFKGVSGAVTERLLEAHRDEHAPLMMLFPEGTTTNGDFLLPFKTGAFLSKAPVLPVILRYPYRKFSPAWDTISGVRHVILLLCQFVNHIEVIKLPVYYPSEQEKEDPKLYADSIRSLMAREGNLTLSNIGLAEKRVYHAALNGNNNRLPRVLRQKED